MCTWTAIGTLKAELRFQLTISDSEGNVDMDTVLITVESTGLHPFVYQGYLAYYQAEMQEELGNNCDLQLRFCILHLLQSERK